MAAFRVFDFSVTIFFRLDALLGPPFCPGIQEHGFPTFGRGNNNHQGGGRGGPGRPTGGRGLPDGVTVLPNGYQRYSRCFWLPPCTLPPLPNLVSGYPFCRTHKNEFAALPPAGQAACRADLSRAGITGQV